MANEELSIRAAHLSDLDEVVAVHTQARTAYYRAGGLSEEEIEAPGGPALRRDAWALVLETDTRTVLCALRAGALAGVVTMGPPQGGDADAGLIGELYQLHVLPEHWGHGVGSRLHAAFVRFLRDSSRRAGRVEAWERNHRALAFYARHGWTPDGHRVPGPAGTSYLRMHLDVGNS